MKNTMYSGMLRWKCGQLAFGFEYLHDDLKVGAVEAKRTGTPAGALGSLQLLGSPGRGPRGSRPLDIALR